MNKKVFWYASGFFTGWAVLNIILLINETRTLFMIAIPNLIAALGWVYSEYRLAWRD
jgi:hypothetical protein